MPGPSVSEAIEILWKILVPAAVVAAATFIGLLWKIYDDNRKRAKDKREEGEEEKEEKAESKKLKQELTRARINKLNARMEALRAATRALGLWAEKQEKKEKEKEEMDKDDEQDAYIIKQRQLALVTGAGPVKLISSRL